MDDMREKKYVFWHSGGGIFLGIIGGVVGAVVLALLFGYVVQQLWNWLMPSLFHLRTITYWEGFGITLLGRLLFGSFGHGHGHGHRHKHYGHCGPKRNWDWNDDEWKPRGGWKKWKFYKDYWREEGKDAFDSYLEKRGLSKPDEDVDERKK